jgi:hypothetical protein
MNFGELPVLHKADLAPGDDHGAQSARVVVEAFPFGIEGHFIANFGAAADIHNGYVQIFYLVFPTFSANSSWVGIREVLL